MKIQKNWGGGSGVSGGGRVGVREDVNVEVIFFFFWGGGGVG